MTTRIDWLIPTGGEITVTPAGLVQDDGLTTLVLIALFTDSRAQLSDRLPDGSDDRRGWPGDSFADEPWGSRLWLLGREKLTTAVRNQAVSYATQALKPLQKAGYVRGVRVVGSIPRPSTLALHITLTRPDDQQINLTIAKRWEAQGAL